MKNFLVSLLSVVLISSCSKDKSKPHTYVVDESQSVIEWKGSAPDHFHVGSFAVSGELVGDANGDIQNGSFDIPIASIKNFDLLDSALNKQLTDHLKSPDFFNIVLYPTASFKIEEVTRTDKSSSQQTHTIRGTFTMLGKSNTIDIPAKVSAKNDIITTSASFSINRFNWGMNSFNDPEEELYILPDVEIKLDITAKRK